MVIPISRGFIDDCMLIERLPEPPHPADAKLGTDAAKPATDESGGERGREKTAPRFRETSIVGCSFVPLIGQQGFKE